MKLKSMRVAAVAGGAVIVAVSGILAWSQAPNLQSPPVDLAIRGSFDVPPADAKSQAIVAAAEAFLATLDDAARAAAVYDFTDNAQRSNWSNFPDGPVQRGGLRMDSLSAEQRAALDLLLAEVLSEDGMRNIVYQLAGDDMLESGAGPAANFGSEFYYVSFLGQPSATAPWMLQFGGHHLAINATVFGPDIAFAPMLTGGEPLRITVDGAAIHTTGKETAAAQALMDSLDATQKAAALRSATPINLLLGPGADGTVLAPEGVRGRDLNPDQKQLLLAVIDARLGFANGDDHAVKMAEVEAGLDDTYFGWWGPEGTLGAAYFRVTGPSLVLEYAPQDMDGDPTDHAHNMYRDPANDYGAAWIAE